jgi:hypothetical protein
MGLARTWSYDPPRASIDETEPFALPALARLRALRIQVLRGPDEKRDLTHFIHGRASIRTTRAAGS